MRIGRDVVTLCLSFIYAVSMKQLVLVVFLCWLSCPALDAQGPDRKPRRTLAEEEIPGTPAYEKLGEFEVADSLLAPNVLLFCGQQVNLDPMNRQRKLRRELASLSRFSPVLMERAEIFFPIVEPILEEHGVPDDFKYLMAVESGMNPEARSPAGALGLWQFMRETAKEYGLNVSRKIDERLDVEKSTHAACCYLLDAHSKFRDWVAVAQSYNIGQNRIGTELKRQKVDEAIDLELVEETNRYIYRLMAIKIIFTHPENFGLKEVRYKKLRRR